MHRERFAPSPTGHLHLGHAYSAWIGFDHAKAAGGEWLLRIEDIDFTRARAEYVEAIYEDLRWLGLEWAEPVMFQSERQFAYQAALEKLREHGLIYGCQCSRKDLALSAPHHAHSHYPGTCRKLGLKGDALNWRLDAQKAKALIGDLQYRETGQGRDQWKSLGFVDDIVLARKDIGTSYHLAVVVDDGAQHITHITRGADLEEQTPIHVLLQNLLGLPTPIYHHHKLIQDETGKRLAKRAPKMEIRALRKRGFTADKLYELLFYKNVTNLIF